MRHFLKVTHRYRNTELGCVSYGNHEMKSSPVTAAGLVNICSHHSTDHFDDGIFQRGGFQIFSTRFVENNREIFHLGLFFSLSHLST